jgi:hypothetical protein
VKYSVKQVRPPGFLASAVSAADTRQALDLVASMVEGGALVVEIIDASGMHYDLIDLERALDEECKPEDR